MSNYPLATWRLLRSDPADGATNMAVDEAIQRMVATGQVPPTLRFYAWEPACLSLGRAQPLADVNLEALRAAGYDLVRRPTGGRGILHVDELTYSVVAPQVEPRVAGGIVESYRRLSAGLMHGLEHLGIKGIAADRRTPLPPAGRAEESKPPPFAGEAGGGKSPVCFQVPSDYEITAMGRKLAGSAQMRARSAVLQHGVLPLYGDITRICPLLTACPDPVRMHARATTIEQALGQPVTWDDVADALEAGFAEALNINLEPGTLTGEERAWVTRLRAEKYATEEWTRRV
ncbi:MAG: biotin/lipoate A/B protein ligase family protein [Chloroflexota bacterium]|nr:biotin/lipoate A/B protein ligase family protein [Chloroflexota bacterium]